MELKETLEMNRTGNALGALIGATLIAFSGGVLAAGPADGECAQGRTQCREAGRDERGADLAPLKKQIFEFAGLPDRQRGPSPSLKHARPGWPVLGQGMSFLGAALSSRLSSLISRFGGR